MTTDGSGETPRFDPSAFVATFVILFSLWLVLSGHYDVFHTMLGVASSGLVAYLSHDLLFPEFRWGSSFAIFFRFLAYLPWLFYQILLANLHVARMVLHPRMPIEPRIVEFDTRLVGHLAKTTLGNSITLTPGTITVDIRDDKYVVHALTQKVADDLLSGEMENRVAAIYQAGQGQRTS